MKGEVVVLRDEVGLVEGEVGLKSGEVGLVKGEVKTSEVEVGLMQGEWPQWRVKWTCVDEGKHVEGEVRLAHPPPPTPPNAPP